MMQMVAMALLSGDRFFLVSCPRRGKSSSISKLFLLLIFSKVFIIRCENNPEMKRASSEQLRKTCRPEEAAQKVVSFGARSDQVLKRLVLSQNF